MPLPPSIRLEQLSVRAGGRPILEIPHLELASGEFLGVLGPNGAGKTTLCRCLLGLQPNATGSVTLRGVSLSGSTESDRRRLRQCVGYVPQVFPATGEMPLTVREVVALGRTARLGLFRRFESRDWAVVDEWLSRLGLSELASRSFTELSGGEQRKTLFARAMAQEPEILLLDEPSANLDLGWRERLVECIQQLHRDCRLTIVLVCHELEVLPIGCRRVVLLVEGRLLADGTPESVFGTGHVAALYGAPLEVVHRGGRHAAIPRGEWNSWT